MATTASLTDDFNDNSVDTTKWPSNNNGAGNTMAETGGQVVITLGGTSGSYSEYTSATSYDLTNSYALVQAIAVTPDAATNAQSYLKVAKDASNLFTIGKLGTNLSMQSRTAAVDSTTTVTYNPAQMVWWRLRNEAGNILWETSATGKSWTVQRTLATPFAITLMWQEIGAGCFGTQANAGGATYDNYNNLAYPSNASGSVSTNNHEAVSAGNGISVSEKIR
jgi:hypothetical protein